MGELLRLLESTGLPVAYNHFKKPPNLPYIIYLLSYTSNFAADNKVHEKINNYQVELYSRNKDVASETLIEDLFDANSIFYNKTETYIDSEDFFQVLYEITF